MIYSQNCINFRILGEIEIKELKENGQVKDKMKRQSWNIENSLKLI